ncbi:hypothetical protein OAM21_03695 [Verrucomicrobia bacterium]|jgi:hypothetical protein|nr:hypothetical protein [Verrucomicrobiota bacterium]
MPEFTCVFVGNDQKTVFKESELKVVLSESPESAASTYASEAVQQGIPAGPYISVKDSVGNPVCNVRNKDIETFQKKIPATPSWLAKDQVESATNQEAQLSPTETNKLLKECLKELKLSNKRNERQFSPNWAFVWAFGAINIGGVILLYSAKNKGMVDFNQDETNFVRQVICCLALLCGLFLKYCLPPKKH